MWPQQTSIPGDLVSAVAIVISDPSIKTLEAQLQAPDPTELLSAFPKPSTPMPLIPRREIYRCTLVV